MKNKKIKQIATAGLLVLSLGGYALSQGGSAETVVATEASSLATATLTEASTGGTTENSLLDIAEMFSNRDLEQEANLEEATNYSVRSDETINIQEEGVYVFSGEATNANIIVEADGEANVQLVFDGVSITNDDSPAVYVKSADKVFITTTDSENKMEVTGDYTPDGDTKLDAVIYSKDDLVFNGLGTLTVISNNGNGITTKDDLKVTGGILNISSLKNSMEANDSIRIYDGTVNIVTSKDALHSENGEDSSLGYIYMQNGELNIQAADDAIHGTSIVQIDGGIINVETSAEGIEGTHIIINGGTIDIYATDDGINATSLSDYDVLIEVNGGDITVNMGSGDTDGFDANGDIAINGGTIDVTGGSTFDADGTAILNGGTVVVNGVEVTELPASQQGKRKKN